MVDKVDESTGDSEEYIPENRDELLRIAAMSDGIDSNECSNDSGLSDDEAEAGGWAVIPAMIGSVLSLGMPKISAVYTQEACLSWGRAAVPVARKYGIKGGDFFGPEATLLISTASLLIGTYACLSDAREEQEKKSVGVGWVGVFKSWWSGVLARFGASKNVGR